MKLYLSVYDVAAQFPLMYLCWFILYMCVHGHVGGGGVGVGVCSLACHGTRLFYSKREKDVDP